MIKLLSKQEIFDTIVEHARKQKVKAQSDDRTCFYRGPNNTKCFIGCLIPDSEYSAEMENESISWIVTKFPAALERVVSNDRYSFGEFEQINFLRDLQKIHDSISLELWEDCFEEFADNNGLNYTKQNPHKNNL